MSKIKSMKSAAAKRASKVFNNIKTLFIRSSTPKAGSKRGVPERDISSSDDDSRDHKRRKLVAEFVASSSYSSSSSSPSSSSDSDSNPNFLSVTDYLQQIPSVVESIQELKSKPPLHLKKSDSRRIINVLQGEVAHATAEQADILVSDKATTCHILALRSTPIDCGGGGGEGKGNSKSATKLASVAHIDQPAYISCIQGMVDLHKRYHGIGTKIKLEVHLVGGFNDKKGSSQRLTEHLLHVLALVDRQEKQHIDMIVKTCFVSDLNDDGSRAPVGRGLAICIKSGDTFLASVDEAVAGPAAVLRNCRLWSAPFGQPPRLCSIHTPFSNQFVVYPFDFEWNEDFLYLCSLTDQELLKETSTSPDVEEVGYCDQVRASLTFMKDNNVQDIFGPVDGRKVLLYKRSSREGQPNEWKMLSS